MHSRFVRSATVLATASAVAIMSCGSEPTGPDVDDFLDEPAPVPAPSVIAFVDVTLVRPELGAILPNHTVVVRDGIIDEVGSNEEVSAPANAFVIQGQGRYLVPGLVDMHVHLSAKTFTGLRNDYQLFLANGVTTVRLMWGFSTALTERAQIQEGTVIGPNLLVASPGLDGPGGPWAASTPPVSTPEEARIRVQEHAQAGYDFIKVYNLLSRASYEAIVDEATLQGIPVVGHVPGRVGIDRVQASGQRTAEHLIGIKLRTSQPFTAGALNRNLVASLAEQSAAAGLWHTPTITVDALSLSEVQTIKQSRGLALVSPGMRDFFENGFHNGLRNDVASAERENHEYITGRISAAGGRLLVGTDAGFGWIVPGFSIHDELEAFVRAGLEPAEALQAATSDAAISVDRSEVFGRIAPGLHGDLVLVTRDPLEDISAMKRISGVMAHGRWYSRGTLEEMLNDIQTSNGGGGPAAAAQVRAPTPARRP